MDGGTGGAPGPQGLVQILPRGSSCSCLRTDPQSSPQGRAPRRTGQNATPRDPCSPPPPVQGCRFLLSRLLSAQPLRPGRPPRPRGHSWGIFTQCHQTKRALTASGAAAPGLGPRSPANGSDGQSLGWAGRGRCQDQTQTHLHTKPCRIGIAAQRTGFKELGSVPKRGTQSSPPSIRNPGARQRWIRTRLYKRVPQNHPERPKPGTETQQNHGTRAADARGMERSRPPRGNRGGSGPSRSPSARRRRAAPRGGPRGERQRQRAARARAREGAAGTRRRRVPLGPADGSAAPRRYSPAAGTSAWSPG